jgi:hypothetical protein
LLIAVIQSCALLKRCFKDSLNGDSHGSSLITPVQQLAMPAQSRMYRSLPVPSGGPAGCALMIEFTAAWLTLFMLMIAVSEVDAVIVIKFTKKENVFKISV